MAKVLIVFDSQGEIKAAARLNPENEFSPTAIEVKPGEEAHEFSLPEELHEQGVQELVNYYVEASPEPRLMRRS